MGAGTVGITRLGLGLLAASPVAAGPQFVQHVATSSTRTATITGSPFQIVQYYSHTFTAGNALLISVSTTNNVTVTASDDGGSNVYSSLVAVVGSGKKLTILGATSAVAGARQITVAFSADPGADVQVCLAEAFHCSGFGTTSSSSGTSATASCSLTASGKDVVYHVVKVGWGNSISFTGGGTLHAASREDGMAAQTGSASMTLSSSTAWLCAAVVLTSGPNGSDRAGPTVRHRHHVNIPKSASAGGSGSWTSPTTHQFPCSGTALAIMNGGGGLSDIISATDSSGNTWVVPVGGIVEVGNEASSAAYVLSPVTSSQLTVTATWDGTQDTTAILYDWSGVSQFDQVTSGSFNQTVAGTLTIATVTPGANVCAIMVATPWDFNTAGGMVGGLIITGNYSGEGQSGPDPIDENNGWGHVATTSNAPITFKWNGLFGGTQFGNGTYTILSLK